MKVAKKNLTLMDQLKRDLVSSDKRILIVDDEAYNCEVLFAIIQSMELENVDNRVDLCMGGAEALEKLQQNLTVDENNDFKSKYGAILTDLSMPVVDGYQLSLRARKMMTERFHMPASA
mmetsp:Transcript_11866/g.18309  ORF Transcript_11866/g.18309 Transcript_11866/m.18309 type:complete len:119 (+) Transcript_11866:2208-2564(+)